MLHSNLGYTADPVRNTEISLKDDTDSKYHLVLFVGNRKIELQKDATQSWTPIQLVYALVLAIYTH